MEAQIRAGMYPGITTPCTMHAVSALQCTPRVKLVTRSGVDQTQEDAAACRECCFRITFSPARPPDLGSLRFAPVLLRLSRSVFEHACILRKCISVFMGIPVCIPLSSINYPPAIASAASMFKEKFCLYLFRCVISVIHTCTQLLIAPFSAFAYASRQT